MENDPKFHTGDVVEITGAFFKWCNSLWVVEKSPGDPGWNGDHYCLLRVTKYGRIRLTGSNLCFWPLVSFTTDSILAAQARRHDARNARIEKATIPTVDYIKAYFLTLAKQNQSDPVMYAHYISVVQYIDEARSPPKNA